MNYRISEDRFAAGVVTGALGIWATWHFGGLVVTSGWTTTACAIGLLAGAASLAATRWLDHGVDPQLRNVSGNLVSGSDRVHARQSERPRDWLRDAGVETVPEGDLSGFLRAKLSACLNVQSELAIGGQGVNLQGAVMALATALAAGSTGRRRREEGMRLIRSLSRCHESDGPAPDAAMSEIMSDAGRLAIDPEVQAVFRRVSAGHGMRETFMMGLLDEARLHGPIGSGEFAWLKEIDHGLWYALSNLGRRSFHVEGLAAMDHYAHEKAAGGRLTAPHVGKATEAMCGIAVAMQRAPLAGGRKVGSEPSLWEDDERYADGTQRDWES